MDVFLIYNIFRNLWNIFLIYPNNLILKSITSTTYAVHGDYYAKKL